MADKEFMVENATIIFRNFGGAPTKFNPIGGKKEFSVILDPEVAEQMAADGWNIKTLAARDEGDEETPFVTVTVNYGFKPPRIVLISSSGRTNIDEGAVSSLDWVDIKTVDIIARGYEWEVNGKVGVKAYLKTMFMTIDEDALEMKYAASRGE